MRIGFGPKGKVLGIGYCSTNLKSRGADGKQKRVYKTWQNMLKRCYDIKYHEKHPTYIGCTVSEDWHDFANFEKWYNDNYYEIPGERTECDKDLLVRDNKIYCPEHCRFVPQSINLLTIDSGAIRGQWPIGVSFRKKNNKFIARLKIDAKEKHLGYFSTPEQAFLVYKEAKQNEIKRKANLYKHIFRQMCMML